MIFDVLRQTDIQGVHDITHVLKDGLIALGDQKSVRKLVTRNNCAVRLSLSLNYLSHVLSDAR